MRSTDTDFDAATRVGLGTTSLAARARVERGGVLTLNQTAVLGLLLRQSSMTPTELSARLHMQPQSLTRILASAERSGWLRRLADPSDGRQSLLSITAAGRHALAEEMRPRFAWLARAMGELLTPAERDLLVVASQLMSRLADFESAVGPGEQ